LNRWIVNEVVTLASTLTKALDAYHFHEASHALYHFLWGRFCDWYLEFTKPILTGADEANKAETRATVAWVMGRILHLMHPFMPFISEELWAHLRKDEDALLITSAWPCFEGFVSDQRAQADIMWLIDLITEIRSLRSAFNIPVAARIVFHVMEAGEDTHRRLETYQEIIERLSRASIARNAAQTLKDSVQLVVGAETYLVPLAGVVDLQEEHQRLRTALEEVEGEIQKLDQKLGNAEFVAKAPPAIIETNQQRRSEAALKQERFKQALERLQ
jgi:valyl-tRNA synthetase